MFKKTLQDIEDEKAELRKATVNAIKGDYEENIKKRFELKTEKLTSNKKVQKVKEEVEQTIVKELKFEGPKPLPMPDFERKEATKCDGAE